MPKTKIKYRNRFIKRKGGGGQKMTIPLAVIAGFASPVVRTFDHYKTSGVTGSEGAIAEFSRIMTGVNPYDNTHKWEPWRMNYGLVPVMLGIGVHKLAGYLGINRAIARAGIPLVRI